MESRFITVPDSESRYLENVGILLMEPNDFMRSTIRQLLAIFGCRRITDAEDGSDAMSAMKAFSPDIIITELDMQPIGGIDFTKLIRTGKESPNKYVPIIMVTAHSDYGTVIRARDAGITEFVVKPISAKSLLRHVVETIEHPRDFVETENYFGPDRRRRNRSNFEGADRRGADEGAARLKQQIAPDTDLSQEEVDQVVAGETLSASTTGAEASGDSQDGSEPNTEQPGAEKE